WLGATLAVFGLWPRAHILLAGAAACVAVVAINDAIRLGFFLRERGTLFAAKAVALDLVYYLVSGVAVAFGWIAQQAIGEPRPSPATEAFAELEVKTWPPVPIKRISFPRGLPAMSPRGKSAKAQVRRPVSESELGLSLSDVPRVIDVPPDAPL